MSLLNFIFHCGWHFAGVVALIVLLVTGVCDIIRAARND